MVPLVVYDDLRYDVPSTIWAKRSRWLGNEGCGLGGDDLAQGQGATERLRRERSKCMAEISNWNDMNVAKIDPPYSILIPHDMK